MPQPGYGMPQPGFGMPYGGYPQQPPGYPGMVQQQPMPQLPAEDYHEEEEAADAVPEPAVKLPDPSETGLKQPEKKDDGGAPKAAAPPNPAEEILKKYKNRR
jgi:hypothetical protein